MFTKPVCGYVGKILRVDLTNERMTHERIDEVTLRKWVGGTGIGIKYLYEEVPPGVKWSDPENRVIMASGPVGGTIGGTGAFSVVTKGPMTKGAVSTQANGFMGAFMKFAGFDGIIVQGAAKNPVYLYLHDGIAELRDASHLAGKDTWETEKLIAEELGKAERQLSTFSIGPAGENLVRFAGIVGDQGHIAAHGGAGAVLGSKKLKAITAARGKGRVMVNDKERLTALSKVLVEKAKHYPAQIYNWGTSALYPAVHKIGALPVKNYTTTIFPEFERMAGPKYRPLFEMRRNPCWACQFNHCHKVKIKQGPYAGFVGDEPEYEGFAAWSSVIGQTDPSAAVVISNEVDRYGMDTNESGWLIAWVMECFEKGLITKKDTDGIEMTWGNVPSTRAMLRKIAYREGFGDILAEGVMRAANRFGDELANLAIYTKKGNTPRGHDHRVLWQMILDTCTSDVGTDEAGTTAATPESLGLPASTDRFSPEGAAAMLAAGHGKLVFEDCLVMCRFWFMGCPPEDHIEVLNAVTGWDFTVQEKWQVARRVINLLRAFNVRHGHTPDLEAPSPRYGSAPVDGPAKGKTILPVWDNVLRSYYEYMGWDRETGKPLPDTLKRFDLKHIIQDIW